MHGPITRALSGTVGPSMLERLTTGSGSVAGAWEGVVIGPVIAGVG
jgi:hypothetical protein